jgi:two-component system chemotaxis sensor kinase CheA
MDNQREIIEEFLVESNESLAQLDQDFDALEERPDDQELLSNIFRAIHTIKGVSGFPGFSTLGAVTHRAENILSQLRDGDRKLTHELTDLLLETFDAVKRKLRVPAKKVPTTARNWSRGWRRPATALR